MTDQIFHEDTESIFIGSGALSYSWWEDTRLTHDYYEAKGYREAKSWCLDASVDDTWVTITHERVMQAVRAIVKDGHGATEVAVEECQHLLEFGPDDVDFDADTADQVLQVAALGKVIFG